MTIEMGQGVASQEGTQTHRKRSCILVLGMHRSGTSALTRITSLLGASLPTHLISPNPDNETGYWEPAQLNRLHDQMLAEAGSGWSDWRSFELTQLSLPRLRFYRAEIARILDEDETLARAPLFVIKDPRISRFVPLYAEVLASMNVELRYLLPFRNPLAVLASLEKRDGSTRGFNALVWLRHELEAERATRGGQRVFVAYEALLEDWRTEVKRITNGLAIAWPRPVEDVAPEIDGFLSKAHRHNSASDERLLLDDTISAWVKTTYSSLKILQNDVTDGAALSALDAVASEFDRVAPTFADAFFPEIEARMRGVRAAAEARLGDVNQLTLDLSAERDHRQRLLADLEARDTELIRVSAELDSERARVDELAAEFATQSAELARVAGERIAERERARELEAQIDIRSGELSQITDELAIQQARSAELAAEVQARAVDLKRLHDERTTQDIRAKELTAEVQTRATEIKQLEGKRAAQQARADSLQAALDAKSAELSRLSTELLEIKKTAIWRTRSFVSSNLRPLASRLGRLRKGVFKGGQRRRDRRLLRIVERSGLIDRDWYLQRYPDVAAAGADPIRHYLKHGVVEGRDPNPFFHTRWYLSRYPDVAAAGINPLIHYLRNGAREGRDPSPLFDTSWYLAKYPDVRAKSGDGTGFGINPLAHFLRHGISEKRLAFAPPTKPTVAPPQPSASLAPLGAAGDLRKQPEPGTELFDQLFGAAKQFGEHYVPLSDRGLRGDSAIRAIAFYLPQFHPIRENNEWWGKGFTEWTNVSKAVPQFVGHYQPHLPGELGFYDLRLPEVQARQIELAKQYGIYGFCFHYYWFTGRKRLLEGPLNQFVAHTEFDFPFCICWANENWTRRWDGLERDVLMAQKFERGDDLQFIEDLAPLLRDRRYIRVDGKPLIVVYNLRIIPDAPAMAKVWRDFCREAGIGEIMLVAAQTFGIKDPRPFGFDAAVEFPPHNVGLKRINGELQHLNKDFAGNIWEYSELAETYAGFDWSEFCAFKTVSPSWDNEARRPGGGSIGFGSSPDRYRDWLGQVCDWTNRNHNQSDEKIVFINAWNEWAEGAHLEPDRRYGYAWLDATRSALEDFPLVGKSQKESGNSRRRIALVSHDAFPAGAQHQVLALAATLRDTFGYEVHIIVIGGGALLDEFAKAGYLYNLSGKDPQGDDARHLAESLFAQGVTSALVNSTVSGLFVATLKIAGFRVVSRVVEMPKLISDRGLQEHAKAIATHSDVVVFPAPIVRDGFVRIAPLDDARAQVLPTGLYVRHRKYDASNPAVREQLRNRFALEADARIFIGVGYADERKGIDLFVETAIKVCMRRRDAAFIWVGQIESIRESELRQQVQESGYADRILFAGRVDREEVDAFYDAADAFLLTSREDPFPSVVLEALAAALPVVIFAGATGCDDLVGRGCGLLVPSFDTDAMALAAESLLERPEEAAAFGALGQAIVAAEHSYRSYAFEFAALCDPALTRVSVVVPAYNHCRHLDERFVTIRDQTYPIYEVIVLDDASTDGSQAWLNENLRHMLPGARLLLGTQNSGSVWSQWIKGIAEARGDIVWIAESDDAAEPTFLAEVLKGFDEPAVVLSYCESRRMNESGDIVANDYRDYVADVSREKWTNAYTNDGLEEIRSSLAIKNTIPNVSAVLFQRQALAVTLAERSSDLAKYRVSGDRLVYIDILTRGRIAFFPSALNRHRRHDTSVVRTTNAVRQLTEVLKVQAYVKDRFGVTPEVREKQEAYAATLYRWLDMPSTRYPTVKDHPDLKPFFALQGQMPFDDIWRQLNDPTPDSPPFSRPMVEEEADIESELNKSRPIRVVRMTKGKSFAPSSEELGCSSEFLTKNMDLDLITPPPNVRADSSDSQVMAAERLLGLSISAVTSGAIRAVDPWSGEILESSCCLSHVGIPWSTLSLLGYRFVGTKVFYLFLTGLITNQKFGVYLPDDEIIFLFNEGRLDEEVAKGIAGWRAFLVKNAETALANIQYGGVRSPVVLLQSMHFAHNIWNELSTVEALLAALPKTQITYLETVAPFGSLEKIFPELPAQSVVRKRCSTKEAHLELLQPGHFIIPGVRRWLPDTLAARIKTHAGQSYPDAVCDADAFRSAAEIVIWITVRTDLRTWIGQVDGIANLITALSEDIPSLAVIFDGFSIPEGIETWAGRKIADEHRTVADIVAKLPGNVRTKSIVGASLCEAIVWSGAADYYVAHHGTLQHKIGWIANPPGVVHAGENLRPQIEHHAVFTAREKTTRPAYVFGNVVRDDTRDARRDAFSYELDWRALFDVAAADIKAIRQQKP